MKANMSHNGLRKCAHLIYNTNNIEEQYLLQYCPPYTQTYKIYIATVFV